MDLLNILSKLIKKNDDEEVNVVDSIVKANALYKKLILKTHPDKNVQKKDIALCLAQKVTASKYDYRELKKLEIEIKEKLEKR